jgi:PAS domain S-box-containing protein
MQTRSLSRHAPIAHYPENSPAKLLVVRTALPSRPGIVDAGEVETEHKQSPVNRTGSGVFPLLGKMRAFAWAAGAFWLALLALSLWCIGSIPPSTSRSPLLDHSILLALGWAGIALAYCHLGRAVLAREISHAALAERERRTGEVLARLPLLTITCTLDGAITYCNPALLALAGRNLADIVGQNFCELFVPREQRQASQLVLQRIAETRPRFLDSIGSIATRDGSVRTVSWLHIPITDERDAPVGVTCLGEDITARNAEDLRLRLLSCAVEQSPATVVITDASGKIEYVNPRFTEVTGYTADDVLGRNPSLLASGETPKEEYRQLWETLRSGREWHGIFHNRRKNGEHFWEDARISPIRDLAGTIVRFVAIKEDITARRRTEQALAESEQRFRTLIENAPVAVVVYQEHRCLYANSAAMHLFGYDEPTQIAGIDIRMHVQPASISTVLEREHRAEAGQQNPPVELELRRCDGHHLTCESIATRITFNGQPATLALVVDITERRQMLAALEASEARYRTLVEVAPVAIFSIANGRFAFANPSAARLFGFDKPADLVGSSLWQRVHTDSLATTTALLTQAEAGTEPPPAELTLLRQDRRPVVCATTVVPIVFGQQSACLAIAIDITERQRLENALRESEARIRETLETTAAGYFLLDRQDHLIHANSAFLQFFEQPTLAAARGRHFVELLSATERPELAEYLLRLSCGEEFVGGQLRHHRSDGTYAYFGFTAHLVREDGALAGSEGFLLDTTAVHTSEERYQLLFEQLLDAFALHEIILDPAGQPIDYRFLAINPAFERLVGKPAAALVGHRAHEIFPALDEKWIARYGQVALTGKPIRIEDYSAEIGRHLEIVAFRTSDARFACLIRDITDQRLLEQQLQQAQKMEAVGQLAGGVAHDYNNILVAILMNLSLLRTESNLRPETAESIAELEREAKRAAALTRQLLVFSRRQTVQAVRLDFNDQLESMLKMLRRLLGEHIAIDADLAPGLPPLFADPGMLDQVVMNLCVNARDAMPSGGRLQLLTTHADFSGPSPAHPEARAGEFLRFCVRDTGTGMDATTRQRIFEPFFTTKEAGRGTGLGLATVFGIVQQHQGWIEVESAPGQGSTFSVYLPFAPPLTEPETAAPAQPAPPTNGSETILLVEDDLVTRQTIGLTLRRDGYHVLEANTAESALALWEQHRTTIAGLITDVVMPGGRTGLELANQLHARAPDLSIIVISGYSDDAIRNTPIVEGATYLAKPFDYATLTQALRASLARKGG